MVNYVIGFKSGARIEIWVPDGEKFVSELTRGPSNNPTVPGQYYAGPGFLFNFSEIEFVLPASSVLK